MRLFFEEVRLLSLLEYGEKSLSFEDLITSEPHAGRNTELMV